MDMFYNKPIYPITIPVTEDVFGNQIQGTPVRGSLFFADIQPTSEAVSRENYGLNSIAKKLMFCPTGFKSGDIVEYDGILFRIDDFLEWDDDYGMYALVEREHS